MAFPVKDERRSLGFGNPMLESNRPVRLSLKASVVSDVGKGSAKLSGVYDGDEQKCNGLIILKRMIANKSWSFRRN